MTTVQRCLLICGAMILLSALVNFSSVVLRLTFVLSYDVFTDLAVWLTIWGALLAGGPLVSIAGGHVAIQFIPNSFSERGRLILRITGLFITLLISLTMAYGGLLMVESLYERNVVFIRYLSVPQWIVKSCIPVSMILIVFYCLTNLLSSMRLLISGQYRDEE